LSFCEYRYAGSGIPVFFLKSIENDAKLRRNAKNGLNKQKERFSG
jgi:hypothetical protein